MYVTCIQTMYECHNVYLSYSILNVLFISGGIGSKRRRSTSSRKPSVSSKGSKRSRSIRSESTQSVEDDDDDQTPSDNYDHLIELRSGLRQLLVVSYLILCYF